MTELEKVRINEYKNIDFNKAIDELSEMSNSFHDKHVKEEVKFKDAADLTINIMLIINALINRSAFDFDQLPFVVAGIRLLSESLDNHMDNKEKELSKFMQDEIAPGITSINFGAINSMRGKE